MKKQYLFIYSFTLFAICLMGKDVRAAEYISKIECIQEDSAIGNDNLASFDIGAESISDAGGSRPVGYLEFKQDLVGRPKYEVRIFSYAFLGEQTTDIRIYEKVRPGDMRRDEDRFRAWSTNRGEGATVGVSLEPIDGRDGFSTIDCNIRKSAPIQFNAAGAISDANPDDWGSELVIDASEHVKIPLGLDCGDGFYTEAQLRELRNSLNIYGYTGKVRTDGKYCVETALSSFTEPHGSGSSSAEND